MQRHPYNRLDWLEDGERWAKNGYVYLSQDARGRYDSEGIFDPFTQEINDTPDAIAWIRRQPWSNGQVGQMGPSYLSWVQTLGVARGDGVLPDAIIPTFAPYGAWHRGWYANGPLSFFLAFWWFCFGIGSRTDNADVLRHFDLHELLTRLPLRTLDVSTGSGVSYLWRELMDHPQLDSFWDKYSILERFERFTMPTLQVAGWYDYYAADMIEGWLKMTRASERDGLHRLVIGPWGHHHDLEPTADGRRCVDFGPESTFDSFNLYLGWFDRAFKGKHAADGLGERPIRLFVMGANKWRDEDEWPLARTRYVRYYLHSAGKANTLHGDGSLDRNPPTDEPPDHYRYDPQDPVPTRGGNHSIQPSNDAFNAVIWCGPSDQRPNEERADVLVYTGTPLEQDLEITGPVQVVIWAASSARDTDYVARLIDVHPDGQAINVTEGVVRARHNVGTPSRPQLLEPGRLYEYTIDLSPTSMVFLRAHRIRLELTSSNFPLWDRNLNTGEHPNDGTSYVIAEQSIHHDRDHPSHIIVPIVRN